MAPLDLPVSTSIVMRPVWKRRQRRTYGANPLDPPSTDEIRDAISVLRLPDAMLQEMPAVWIEATKIMEEASA